MTAPELPSISEMVENEFALIARLKAEVNDRIANLRAAGVAVNNDGSKPMPLGRRPANNNTSDLTPAA